MVSTMARALVLLQLSLLCLSVFSEDIEALHPITLPPAAAPTHHRHHHHHGHPPTQAPTPHPHHHHHHNHLPHAPSPAPLHPPTHAPAHAPIHPPTPRPHPPLPSPPLHPHPPVKPPVHPVKPPIHPPSRSFPRSLLAVRGVVYCKSCKYAGVDTLLGATPVSGAIVKLQCNNTKKPLVEKATTDKNGYFFLEASKNITNYAFHKCKVSLLSSPDAKCGKPSDLHGGISGGVLRPEPYDPKKKYALFTVGPFAFEPICPR